MALTSVTLNIVVESFALWKYQSQYITTRLRINSYLENQIQYTYYDLIANGEEINTDFIVVNLA